jgi:hypothetical protein
MVVHLVLLIFAFVCFVLAACNVPSTRVNLTPLGLAFWVAAEIFPAILTR